MNVQLFNQSGKVVKDIDLKIEEIRVSKPLLHLAVVRAHSNARKPIARTLKRSERRGGGIKPRPQKGSGRSRQGSIRAPQWKKGGRVFGPTGVENYVKGMPKSARRAAVRQALAVAAGANRLHALEAIEIEAPKTKAFLEILSKLPIDRNYRRILVITSGETKNLVLSTRNIPSVKLLDSTKLNVPDLLTADAIIAVGRALDDIRDVLAKDAITKQDHA